MRAVTLRQFGAAENLKISDLAAPTPSDGEAAIAVEAAGVGTVDVLLRQGALGPLVDLAEGWIPGVEVVGTVTAVGTGLDQALVGERVFALLGDQGGGYAEVAVTDGSRIARVPSTLSAPAALAVGVNGLVGHFAIERTAVRPGEQVLIRGASGGIGVHAIQLCAAAGAIVSVTTASRERGKRLIELGATHVLDRDGAAADGSQPTFDVVIDIAAGPDVGNFIQRLEPNGRMVVVGAVAGMPPADYGMSLFMAFKSSPTVSALSLDSVAPPDLVRAAEALFAAASARQLLPVVHAVLPMTSVVEAHRLLETGVAFGKVVLTPMESEN